MKNIILLFLVIFTLIPNVTNAGLPDPDNGTFEAKIIEILDERELKQENGDISIQQNLELKALNGWWTGDEFIYQGISDIEVLNMANTRFEVGDKVLVNRTKDIEGNVQFYILNYVRRGYLYLLGLIFAITVIIVGKKKGFRSLISLAVSFLIITKFIIPQILNGGNPLIISLIGSTLILGLIIYITDGFNKKTHLALISVALSLFLTFIISLIFVNLTKLTGFASEEAAFLVGTANIIDFRGLLLAGILIGTLGVLDDVIVGQVEAVNQIKKLNPNLKTKEVIKAANEIGRTHLGAIINTLFLTYAGASLPLLILFSLDTSAVSWLQGLDNELITTEIVRTLTGSIGLALAFPITTIITAYFLKIKDLK